uniref:chemotaxis-specific protein-glutamate methyltransferase CheB n=1 Tax=Ningiella ruwaisensis TaxID=2364274 RepID=UPI00109EF7A4|nr:chemotaxis-specific protein-glutamate methyltransferase CheB [Ningiella ruwaisensis]
MFNQSSLRVLVVDDSSLMRRHICDTLSEHGMTIEVAKDGQDCLEKIPQFRPDVITLDINMPVMDGFECLKKIMSNSPLPVLIVSSLSQEGASETLKALELGAVDYVAKPHGPVSLSLKRSKYMLVEKVKAASKARVNRKTTHIRPLSVDTPRGLLHKAETPQNEVLPQRIRDYRASVTQNCELIIIGVSTGGPASLQEIIPQLPANFPIPIVIAQHMPARFTQVFAQRLDKLSNVTVQELSNRVELQAGKVYIAQGDANVEVYSQGGKLCAKPNTDVSPYIWKPSITHLVESALSSLSARKICCVQLTGMGDDGAKAMAKAHSLGAITIAESEQTSVVYGMPKELVKLNGASKVLPNYDISKALMSL